MRCIERCLACIMIMTLTGCSGQKKEGKPTLAVSFEPQAWMLRQIVGDDFDIITLLPAGSDPETYQPSVSTMKGLADAKAYFSLNTPGFEQKLIDNATSNFKSLDIIDCGEDIEKITDTHEHAPGHLHEKDGHDNDNFDPHLLTSVRNCMAIADKMTEKLLAIYPDKASQYRESGNKLKEKLTSIDETLKKKELNGKAIAISHPSLSYFSRDYGLNQITIQENGKETSPIQKKRRIDIIRKHQPKLFVVEREHSTPSDFETARELGIDTINVSLNSAHWLDDIMRLSNEIDRN